jgi:hypothetical protein
VAPGGIEGLSFAEHGALLLGDAQGIAIQFLSGLGIPLLQQQLTFVPIQLPREPALPCPVRDPQSIVQQGQGLFNLPCDLTRPGQESDMKPGLILKNPA